MKHQYFNGFKFTLDESSGYYSCSKLHKYMHRYVWECYKGEIPKGYEIHHIDGNKANNDINNLQCVPKRKHNEIHSRNLTEADRKWRRNNVAIKARPKAIEWHKSEKGLRWHKEQVAYRKDNRTSVSSKCLQCGMEFECYNSVGHAKKFCSGACEQKYRRQNGLNNIEAVCCICGNTFVMDKYKPKKTCSMSCAAKLYHLNKKGN